MRRFIILSTILTLLLLSPFTLGGILLPCVYQETYLGEFPYKIKRLKEEDGKRIILIGGSAMAFAIDSGLLEQEFPTYTAVNLGMYGDLGIKLPLDFTLKELRNGDIVLFIPEQHERTLSLYLGGRCALQAMDGAFSLLWDVPIKDLPTLLGALPSFSLEKWRYTLGCSYPAGDGIYRRSSFNTYGDINSPLAQANVLVEGFDPTVPISYETGLLDSAYVSYLNRFYEKAKKKGAKVYFGFCPANRLAKVGSAAPEDFYEALYSSLSFPILGNPGNALLDPEWFYDTNFHLNRSGRTLYTRQLIRDLKAMEGITTATNIPIPRMPPMQGITGTVITPELYAGDTKIKEVWIPADTIRIENNAFSGCTRLEKIHLQSNDPSRIQIGEDLLTGTPAELLVPKGSLSAYKTSYRFSRYAGRIQEERN